MKKCLTFPFLVLAFAAFAQPKIHSITTFEIGKEKQKTVQLFDYQDNGLTVRLQNWDYKRVDSTPDLLFEEVTRFTASGQLLSQENKLPQGNRVQTFLRLDNVFDVNGCQTESRSTDFAGDKPYRVYVYSTKTNANCRISEQRLRKYTFDNKGQPVLDSFETVKTFEYDSRDSLKIIRFNYFYKGVISNGTPPGLIEYVRQADGKVTEIYEKDNCEFCIDLFGKPERLLFTYNANNQVITQKKLIYGTQLSSIDTFSYNAAGKLSREIKTYFDGSGKVDFRGINNYEYDNYCDNLLKTKTTQSEFQGDRQLKSVYKTIYAYTERVNCDKKDEIKMIISPNPAQFHAIIASEALSAADCTLTVHNVAGALMQTYKIAYRTTKFDFSTAQLASGTYILRLTNDKNSVTQKLVVLH